ncbi:thioredoxin family protein [Candidatus Saccharibacteria bacterium]|nr:thioredoxin family protein [Candidatus Saccharibacteria bacterium]
MTTKKTQPSSKTAKKSLVKKTKSTTAKKASAPVQKTVKSTEPYSPIFGVLLLFVCAITAAALLIAAIKTIARLSYGDDTNFSEIYTQVDADNVYKIKTAEETIAILEHGTGVVFIGFPSCPWCQAYAPMLNDLAKDYDIKEIYYFDIKEDRENNTESYQKIVELLSDYLQYDNTGNKRVYVPETAFVMNGEIIGNDWETSKDTLGLKTPEEYWTAERIKAWEERVGPLMEQVKATENCATSCNE